MEIKRFKTENLNECKDFFEKTGFVIIQNLLTQEVLSDFKHELIEIIKAHLLKACNSNYYSADNIFDIAMMDLESQDHKYIASIYDTISQCPSFLQIYSNKYLIRAVKFLMGNNDAPLYCFTNRCRIDPPKDERRTYGWHQEVFYTIPQGNYLQTWAPLIRDTTVKNGTIRIAVGSHKEGIAKQTWNEIDGRATQIIVDKEVADKYDQISLEMQLGEILIFSGYLAHQSGVNSSNEYRYSLVGMYHDVAKLEFETPKLSFNYRGESPSEYFQRIMK